MSEQVHVGDRPVTEGADDFGAWLLADEPRQRTPEAKRSEPAGERVPMRPTGPLAALAGGAMLPAPRPEAPLSATPMLVTDRPFRPLERPAAMTLVLLAALAVAGAYAVHVDLRSAAALGALENQNASIREYNRTRNVLVRHLAQRRAGRLARLKDLAQRMGRGQEEGSAVILPGADGRPEAKGFVRVDLADVRREIDWDIAEIEEWTPPPPVQGYDEMTFASADLLASRLPVALGLAGAMAGLIGWCFCAYANLPALGAGPTSFRPLAAVACWLLPVGNLFMPCAIMGEVWHGSDPQRLRAPNGFRLPVAGFWWLAVLASVVLLAMSMTRMASAEGIAAMVDAAEFTVYADGAAAGVAVVTAMVVLAASLNQSRRRRLLAETRTTSAAVVA